MSIYAGGGGGGREERVCLDTCGSSAAAGGWEGITTSATHVIQWKKQVPGTSHNNWQAQKGVRVNLNGHPKAKVLRRGKITQGRQ